MFVQVFEGMTDDREAFVRLMERWRDDLRASAPGFLGSTSGVTPAGHAIGIARFQDASFAERNSERTDQGSWWSEVEKTFTGEPSFTESTDISFFGAGGSDDAGFVQIIRGTAVDRAELERLDAEMFEQASIYRPDVIGGVRIWHHGDRFIEVVYFTSEADARKGESTSMPAELESTFERVNALMRDVKYDDLDSPLLFSA